MAPVPLSLQSPLSPFSYNHSPSPVAGKCHHLSPLSPRQKANGFGGTGPGDTICDQVTLAVTSTH